MRVIALPISTGWYLPNGEQCPGPGTKEICTVTRAYISPTDGKVYYDLKEYPPTNNDDGYAAQEFLPLLVADENDLENLLNLQ